MEEGEGSNSEKPDCILNTYCNSRLKIHELLRDYQPGGGVEKDIKFL